MDRFGWIFSSSCTCTNMTTTMMLHFQNNVAALQMLIHSAVHGRPLHHFIFQCIIDMIVVCHSTVANDLSPSNASPSLLELPDECVEAKSSSSSVKSPMTDSSSVDEVATKVRLRKRMNSARKTTKIALCNPDKKG